ncbi:orexin receptor type 2-like isoform X3 [Biomphalaria glabrata]|uniref:Orexin receptor type 2-like isoform X3 n=1 Tax=Biomphalaria glabrata TaxID=6526 RepID=A0A9W3AH37_BIOGL|nr:orexin receptor type 2-like isoform X3 [Biomphalaria glabrata]
MSQNLSDAAESLNDSLDASRCKYYHKSDLMVQCYYDDEHLLREIYAFIELTNLEWVITVIYALVFITGVVGNFLVGYAVWRNKYLRTITNFFLTNLAVADFLTIVFCLPPSFAQTILETWFLGNTMCKMVSYLQNVAVIVSVLTLTSISIERWFAICQPLTFQQTKSRVIVCVVIIWAVAHIASIPKLIMMEEIHDIIVPPNLTIFLTSCGPRDDQVAAKYEIFLSITFFAIPIAIMGYNYTAIAICLWSSSTSSRQLTEGDQQAIVSQLMARRRTAKMLVVVVLVFFLCFLPNYVWNIIRHTCNLDSINEFVPPITLISKLLLYANSCTNPVIYNFMSGKFRKEFRTACSCCFRCCCNRQRQSQGQVHEMEPLSAKRYYYVCVLPANQLFNIITSFIVGIT